MFEIHNTSDLSNVTITYTLTDKSVVTCVCQFRSDATDIAIAAYAQAWLDNANAELALKQANEIVAPIPPKE